MAVLSDSDRFDTWADWMRQNTSTITINKSDLRAVIDALDAFMNTNATAINNAIPQPGRAQLTAAQKASILAAVVMKRWGAGA